MSNISLLSLWLGTICEKVHVHVRLGLFAWQHSRAISGNEDTGHQAFDKPDLWFPIIAYQRRLALRK